MAMGPREASHWPVTFLSYLWIKFFSTVKLKWIHIYIYGTHFQSHEKSFFRLKVHRILISEKIAWVSSTAAWSLIWVRPGPWDWAWHNGGRPRGCGGTRPCPLRSGASTPAPWPGPSQPPPTRQGSGSSRRILTRSVPLFKLFGSDRSSRSDNLRLFGPSLSIALNLHLSSSDLLAALSALL